MSDSILTSIKKNLGIAEEYTAFDPDITMYINSALSTLTQLGVGPAAGLTIESASETWDDFLIKTPNLFNSAKNYVTLRVKLIFDPPSTGYVLTSFEKQITELEWRLNVQREHTDWVDPNIALLDPNDVTFIEGGRP